MFGYSTILFAGTGESQARQVPVCPPHSAVVSSQGSALCQGEVGRGEREQGRGIGSWKPKWRVAEEKIHWFHRVNGSRVLEYLLPHEPQLKLRLKGVVCMFFTENDHPHPAHLSLIHI